MDNLEWQWADLKPGDIIKISKEFEIEIETIAHNNWWKSWINKEIKILSCELSGDMIYLDTDCATSKFDIKLDGSFWSSSCRTIVFDIVKLVED